MPTILGANTLSSGYEVANSLRFNDGSTDNLSDTFSASNRRTWTWSAWIKRGDWSANQSLFTARSDGGNYSTIRLEAGRFHIFDLATPSFSYQVKTSRYLRDVSAWYHLMVAFDTTQGTAANRVKLYVNGVQETDLAESSYPSENYEGFTNNNLTHYVGLGGNLGDQWDGYMAEVCFIDGTALTPTSFGEFDSDTPNIWKPIDVSGLTFGTNGFYMEFKQSGTGTDSSGMGADTSGNDNHFAVNNLASDSQTTDTCTNNFATLNFNNGDGTRTQNDTYSEGNTIMIPANHDNYTTTFSTMGAKRGKWYWEAQSIVQGTASNAYYPRTIGIMRDDYGFDKSTLGQDDDKTWDVVYNSGNWDASHNNSVVVDNMSTDRTSGNILNFALDLDNGKFYFGINGTYLNSGDPTTGSTGTGAIHTLDATDLSHFIIPAVTSATTGTYYKFNFGQPAFSISSGNADANGHGNFEYAPPSGYFAWCSKNLAEQG